jgi:hypothetical protein
MTVEEFKIFWESTYPDTVPIGHYFKYDYHDRWFRIHSLPDSRRYPEDEGDWEILLNRQNTILTDLLTNKLPILIVTGDHTPPEGYIELQPIEDVKSIKPLKFTRLEPIDLHLLSQDKYEKGQTYTPMFTKEIWHYDRFNEILKDVAEWNLEAFFISIDNNCIAVPYDGGMDIILKDSQTRDLYKAKYKQWLSPREDGF